MIRFFKADGIRNIILEKQEMTFREFCKELDDYTPNYLENPDAFPTNKDKKNSDRYLILQDFDDTSSRGKANVTAITGLSLDIDDGDTFNRDKLKDLPFAYYAHSTFSNSAENPRMRILIPFAKKLVRSDYPGFVGVGYSDKDIKTVFNNISERVADTIGIDQIDPASFKLAQGMYYPSYTEKNKEMLFKDHSEGVEMIDPTAYGGKATKVDGECDLSILLESIKNLPSPKEKNGIIGAVCRAYSVSEGIERFLPEVYERYDDGSTFTYIKGTGVGGLRIYNDDTYAYSFHSSDPAGLDENGKRHAVNLYDLIMAHNVDTQTLLTDPEIYKEFSKGFRDLGIMKLGNEYVTTGKDPKPLTNFVIEPIELMRVSDPNTSSTESFLRCNLISEFGVEKDEELNFNIFDSKAQFKARLGDTGAYYSNDTQLQLLKVLVRREVLQVTRGVDCIGFHTTDGNLVFVGSKNSVMNKNGKLLETTEIRIPKTNREVDTNLLEQEPMKDGALEFILPSLFNFNDINVTAPLLTVLFSQIGKKRLRELTGYRAKHILVSGQAGSGKSATINNIVNPLLGKRKNDVLQAGNITLFTAGKKMSRSNAIPVVIDEYKPSKMTSGKVKLISNILRNAYDTSKGERGNADQSTTSYYFNAPLILVGEENISETAVVERSMVVNFSKQSREGCTDHFKDLSNCESALNGFGREILNTWLLLSDEELIGVVEEAKEKADINRLKDDRVQETMILANVGILILQKTLSRLGKRLEDTGYDFRTLSKTVEKAIFINNLEGERETKPVVNDILDYMINSVIYPKRRGFGEDSTIVNRAHYVSADKKVIGLQTTRLYPYVKAQQDLVGFEVYDNHKAFVTQLQSQDYYIGRPGDSAIGTVPSSGGSKVRMHRLDVEKLIQAGIEVSILENPPTDYEYEIFPEDNNNITK